VTLRPRTSGALLLTGLVALGGCGGSDKGDKQSSKTTQSAPSAAQSTSTSPSGKKVAVPEQAIATRSGSMDQKPVTLEIVELKRSGGTSALTFRVSARAGASGAQVAQTFDDGLSQKLKDATDSGDTLDGISLVDSKNRKRYLVGRDANGHCVCDSNLSNAFANEDAPVILSATFAAPPPDVSAMDVVVPKFGTFKDVPVS
jgi:hypothetical protein